MMQGMVACARRQSPLPYAAFITKILRAFNINPLLHKREESTVIDHNSLRRMNFSLVNNSWLRNSENITMRRARERREMKEEDEEERAEEEENNDSEEEMPQGGESQGESVQLLGNMMRMMEDMRDGIDQINTRLQNLEVISASHTTELCELSDFVWRQQGGGGKQP